MPDEQGNLTDQEVSQALGWSEDTIDIDEPQDVVVSPTATPSPAPSPAVPPIPTAAPTPNYEDLYRQQAVDAQREANVAQVRQDINQRASSYKTQLLAQGTDDAVAQDAASRFATGEWHRHQAETSAVREEGMARDTVAQRLATKHGVNVDDIKNYPDPATMEAAAIRRSQDNTRLTTLEAQVKKATLTATQEFDSGQGGGSLSNAQKKMAYATGEINLTTQEYNELYN